MREKLAELAHDQWSGWIKYMFGKCIEYKAASVQAEDGALIIPKWAVDRWRRQANTSYEKLFKAEKDSDRVEADRFLAIFNKQITDLQSELNKYLKRVSELTYECLAASGEASNAYKEISGLKADLADAKAEIWSMSNLVEAVRQELYDYKNNIGD